MSCVTWCVSVIFLLESFEEFRRVSELYYFHSNIGAHGRGAVGVAKEFEAGLHPVPVIAEGRWRG